MPPVLAARYHSMSLDLFSPIAGFRIELSSVPFKGLPDKDGEFFVNIGPRSSYTLFANGIGIAYRLQEIRCALLANGQKTEMVGIVDLRISGIRDLFRQPIRKHRNRDFGCVIGATIVTYRQTIDD
ncbi:hypothetical protein ACDY97_07170 [Rhizobium mongolense]|uniref:hypothetical protein n=1 Tax=Rhizobium mongolense TaxID=57676 RepID=UPI003558AAE7